MIQIGQLKKRDLEKTKALTNMHRGSRSFPDIFKEIDGVKTRLEKGEKSFLVTLSKSGASSKQDIDEIDSSGISHAQQISFPATLFFK